MNILRKIFTIVLVFASGYASAQDFPYQYFSNFNPMISNPAFTAFDSEIRTDVGMYNLWAGGFKPLNDYQFSFAISPDLKTKKHKRNTGYEKRIGLGAVFLREQIGAFSQNIFQLVYAYHFPFSKSSFLSFGITSSVETLNIDINSLSPISTDDPRLLTGNNHSVLFDGGVGAAVHGWNYNISFSVLNLASDNFKFETSVADGINNYTKYYFSGTYNFELRANVHFQPNVTMRNSRIKKYNFDTSMTFDFTSFSVGMGYRSENSLFFYTRIPYKSLFFTYTSENPMSSNHMIGNGHTFSLGWCFNSPKLY